MTALLAKYGPAAVVTGASSGIGQAFAEHLAAEGLDLVLVARRSERLSALKDKLERENHISVRTVVADLGAASAAQAVFEATADLDVGLLISNAGFSLKGAHAGNDSAEMADMLMVNCQAPLQLTHDFIPRLKARGQGGIILVSSVEGLIGCPYSAAYSATKALVKALGEALWAELQPDGIDVLTLCPGATESEAAARSGIDIATLKNVMKAEDVAALGLANLANGPIFISSEHYRKQFETLLAMPRRDALMAMAASLRPSLT